ncbi:hypothetical protein H6A07_07295 [Olsenella uli]|nr:hypothetical protein [Olsenella uli]
MGFIQDKRRGKVGEKVVKGYFEAIGADIRDLSEESEYQAQDVDLIAADGLTYEVKTDYRFSETGNLALEDSITNAYGKHKSWLWTSKADYFCFVDPNQESKFVAIKAEDLRHLVRTESFRRVTKDDEYKFITLYLLPYWKYQECFETYEY